MKYSWFMTYLLTVYFLQVWQAGLKSIMDGIADVWIRTNVKGRHCLLVGGDHRLVCSLSSLFSDRNTPCCRNCMFEKAGTKCQEAISATCKGESYCTGV